MIFSSYTFNIKELSDNPDVKALDRFAWTFVAIQFLLLILGPLLSLWRGTPFFFVDSSGIISFYISFLSWTSSIPTECSPWPLRISVSLWPVAGASAMCALDDSTSPSKFLAIASAHYILALIWYNSLSSARRAIWKGGDVEYLKQSSLDMIHRVLMALMPMAFFVIQVVSGMSAIQRSADYYQYTVPTSEEMICESVPAYMEHRSESNYMATSPTPSSIVDNQCLTIDAYARIKASEDFDEGIKVMLAGQLGGQTLVLSLFTYEIFTRVGRMTVADLINYRITWYEAMTLFTNLACISVVLLMNTPTAKDVSLSYHTILTTTYYFFTACISLQWMISHFILSKIHSFYTNRVPCITYITVDPKFVVLEADICLYRDENLRQQQQIQHQSHAMDKWQKSMDQQTESISNLQVVMDNIHKKLDQVRNMHK